jgi:hypothetical protein
MSAVQLTLERSLAIPSIDTKKHPEV